MEDKTLRDGQTGQNNTSVLWKCYKQTATSQRRCSELQSIFRGVHFSLP